MSPFDLRTSPLYLLGFSPRDDRTTIEDALETAISDGSLSEAEALRLPQILLVPRRRLGAELAWLLGVAPNQENSSRKFRYLLMSCRFAPLAAANIAAHRDHLTF